MSLRRLYLVRHPRTLAPPGACYGATNVPVDPAHLLEVVQTLPSQLPAGLNWRVSELDRARELVQTLQARGVVQGQGQVDARLNEMDFGDWEMRLWADIDAADLQTWTDAFATFRCGGQGESVGMLMDRVASVCREVCAPQGGDEIWFTHAGVIRAVRWHFDQNRTLNAALRASDWPADTIPYGSVTQVSLARIDE